MVQLSTIPPAIILSGFSIATVISMLLMLKALRMRKDLVKARLFLQFDRLLKLTFIVIWMVIVGVIIYTSLVWMFPHKDQFGWAFFNWEVFLVGGYLPLIVLSFAIYVGLLIYSMLR